MCPRFSLGEGATCQGLQIVRQASPRRACTRLTASAAAMVSSTTSSGGTHGGNSTYKKARQVHKKTSRSMSHGSSLRLPRTANAAPPQMRRDVP